MTVELWLGKKFSHSHERRALDKFMVMMRRRYQSSEELFLVLASYNVEGSEVDITVLKSHALIAIELKECHEPFQASENGDWVVPSSSYVIKTGNLNPYQQVAKIRGKWIDFIRKHQSKITERVVDRNLVNCMVCISPTIHPESSSSIPGHLPLFRLVGLDEIVDAIDQMVSPFELNETEMRQIVRVLNLTPAQDPMLSKSFIVPFPRNPTFVARDEELQKVHQAIQEGGAGSPVLISGMGGVGKTQLAVHYAYDYYGSYPEGVFWVNAANDLTSEFAGLAERLELTITPGPETVRLQRLARAFLERVNRCSDALIIFDNADDPLRLRVPYDYFVLANLNCHILITSVKKGPIDAFVSIPLLPLATDDSLKILIPEAVSPESMIDQHRFAGDLASAMKICQLLGNLPLALALSRAYLNDSGVRLDSYLERLQVEGGLSVDQLDLDRGLLPTRHEVIVSATLEFQWKAVQNQDAYTLMWAAALCHEEEIIPLERLSLLTGLPRTSRPGHLSPFDEAFQKLVRLSLVEFLNADQIRLHPLIREFVRKSISDPEEKVVDFTDRLCRTCTDPWTLMVSIDERGVDYVLEDIQSAQRAAQNYGMADLVPGLYLLSRLVALESHTLRQKDAHRLPNAFLLQQLRNRAMELNWESFVFEADAILAKKHFPCLLERFPTSSDSGMLDKTLVGHTDQVSTLYFMKDRKRLLSASHDGTIRTWDISTGKETGKALHFSQALDILLVSPDERLAVTVSHGEETWTKGVFRRKDPSVLCVLDLQSGSFLYSLCGYHTEKWTYLETEKRTQQFLHQKYPPASLKKRFRKDVWTGSGAVAFVDAEQVLIATIDHQILLYNLNSRKIQKGMGSHSTEVIDMRVFLEDFCAVSASVDGVVKVWSLKSFSELRSFQGYPSRSVAALVRKNHVVAWFKDSPKYWRPIDFPVLHPDETFEMRFTSHLIVWDIQRGDQVYSEDVMSSLFDEFDTTGPAFVQWVNMVMRQSPNRHLKTKLAPYKPLLQISPDQRWIIAHNIGYSFFLFDMVEQESCQLNLGFSPYDLIFTRDSKSIILGGAEDSELEQITRYYLEDNSFQDIGIHESMVTALAIDQEGQHLASGLKKGDIKLWSLAEVVTQDAQKENAGEAAQTAISRDGEKVAVYGAKCVRIIDRQTWNVVYEIQVEKIVRRLYFSIDNQFLWMQDNQSLTSFDLVKGQIADQMPIGFYHMLSNITLGEIAVGEHRALLQEDYKTVTKSGPVVPMSSQIWDVHKQEMLHQIHATKCWLSSTQNGGLLLMSESDGIGVYDVDSLQLLFRLEGIQEEFKDVRTTRDGSHLVGVSEAGEIIVWDLLKEKEKARYDEDRCKKTSYSFTDDCQVVVFTTETGVHVWLPKTSTPLFFMPGAFQNCETSPKGDYLLLIDAFQVVHFVYLFPGV